MRGAAAPASMPSCPPSSPRGFPSAASPASFGATATLAGFFRFGIRGAGAGGGRSGEPAPLGPEDAAAAGPATSPRAQPSRRRGRRRPAPTRRGGGGRFAVVRRRGAEESLVVVHALRSASPTSVSPGSSLPRRFGPRRRHCPRQRSSPARWGKRGEGEELEVEAASELAGVCAFLPAVLALAACRPGQWHARRMDRDREGEMNGVFSSVSDATWLSPIARGTPSSFYSIALSPLTSTNSALISSERAHPRALDGHLRPRPSRTRRRPPDFSTPSPSVSVPSLYPSASICRGLGTDHHRRADGRPEHRVYDVVCGSGPLDEPVRVGFNVSIC
uniref:Uncharacterized protein n=1 Tax=Oryza glumipatula TaxID=40148 RepID=A0A0D9Z6R9_9ORYZ